MDSASGSCRSRIGPVCRTQDIMKVHPSFAQSTQIIREDSSESSTYEKQEILMDLHDEGTRYQYWDFKVSNVN